MFVQVGEQAALRGGWLETLLGAQVGCVRKRQSRKGVCALCSLCKGGVQGGPFCGAGSCQGHRFSKPLHEQTQKVLVLI